MADRDREQLLGYLLGALEDDERVCLARQLRLDRSLRRKLARVRRELGPLRRTRRRVAVPPTLAARTCRRVFEYADRQAALGVLRPARRRAAMSAVLAPPAAASRWNWADLAVAVGIFLAAGLLLFPAIGNSRFHAQVAACQDNLRQIGVALAGYADRHNVLPQLPGQLMPRPEDTGDLAAAGASAPPLWYAGYVTEPRRFLCPASPPAVDRQLLVADPVGAMLLRSPEELDRVRPALGGSYAYTPDYSESRAVEGARNLHRSAFALLADSGQDPLAPQGLSHAGRGRNVLFEAGQVMFVTAPGVGDDADGSWPNGWGLPGAGPHLFGTGFATGDAAPAVPTDATSDE
jgi:hypothetical protein